MPVSYKNPHFSEKGSLADPKKPIACSISLTEAIYLDFVDNAPGLANRLCAEALVGDIDEICHVANLLKNKAKMVNALKLSKLCSEMVELCNRGETGGILHLSTMIEQTCREILNPHNRIQ